MKTERRHELQTNVLATSLARWIETARPYSRAALALVIALVAAVFAWGYYSSQSSRRQADGWDEYYDAMTRRDPNEKLAEIVEGYAGTPVAHWARVVLADMHLDQGTDQLFVNKSLAREELRKTIEAYQAVLIESDQPALLQRATFGLARAREALGRDLAKAREEYLSIAKRWPDSPFAAPAEDRAKDLGRLETKNFYDWFAKYEPPRPMSGEPGTPGVRPDFMKDSLDGGVQIPSLLDSQPIGPNLSTEPAGQAPAEPADEAKPAAAEAGPEPAPSESAGDDPAPTADDPSAKPPTSASPEAPVETPGEPAPKPE